MSVCVMSLKRNYIHFQTKIILPPRDHAVFEKPEVMPVTAFE
jgi:hypothetical protein